jgi:putative ABC transport system permease protein
MRFLAVVWQDIKATKLRSALTCLSMLVGVLAVVGVSAAGAVTEELFVAQSEQTTARIATYRFAFPTNGNIDTALKVYQELKNRIGAQPVGFVVQTQQSKLAVDQNGTIKASVENNWTEGDLSKVRRLPLVAGTIRTDTNTYPPQLTLNTTTADDLGVGVGDTLLLTSTQGSQPVAFTVTAIIADGATDGNLQAYAPLSQAILIPGGFPIETAQALITVPTTSEAALRQMLAATMTHTGIGQQPIDRADNASGLRETLRIVQAVFIGCGALALGVSALGILNIGLASINERSQELVIRRAIGARKRDILAHILASAILIGIASSILAITIAAIALTTIVPGMVPPGSPIQTPTFPLTACAWGILAAITTSLTGATIPALKASKLPVAQALRN